MKLTKEQKEIINSNSNIRINAIAGSGKTTTANLIRQMDSRYEIFSFGKKVKDVAVDLFNMKEKDRTLLTSIGTKMREIDSEVWINYILKQTKIT